MGAGGDFSQRPLVSQHSGPTPEPISGVVETKLGPDITDASAQGALREFRKIALEPDVLGRAVIFAVSQPDGVDVNEVIVRPTVSAF